MGARLVKYRLCENRYGRYWAWRGSGNNGVGSVETRWDGQGNGSKKTTCITFINLLKCRLKTVRREISYTTG